MISDLKNIRILAVLACILFIQYNAQVLAQGEYVIELDRITGTFVETGPPIEGIHWVYPNDRTYDESNGRFYLSASSPNRIYSINTSNGSIVNNPFETSNTGNYEFDKTNGTLYGTQKVDTDLFFGSINQTTAAFTQIGNGLGSFSSYQGINTFNESTHTYYILTGSNSLMSVNAQNGNIIFNPVLNLVSGESMLSISFDNSANLLYGVLKNNNSQNYYLVRINPSTGVTTPIGSGTNLGAGNGSTAIDKSNQQLIYMYSNGSGYYMTTFNLSDGSVLYNCQVNPLCAQENVNSIEYDNVKEKLYSIHWANITPSNNDTTLCQDETYTINAYISGATYLWQDNSTASTYSVSQAGVYWVEINANGCVFTDTTHVNYNPIPTLNFGNDTSLCQGETLILDATNTNATYLWQDNSINPSFNVTQQGRYWTEVTINNCSKADTIIVNYDTIPTLNFGNDTSLCHGETLLLDATSSNASYLWQDNSTNPSLNISQQGTYWTQITNNCGSSSDTIHINYNPIPNINFGNDTTLCQGETLILDVTTSNATYLWQDNSTNPTLNVTEEGRYWTKVTLFNCYKADTIIVDYTPIPTINLGNDTTLCQGEVLILDATASNATYLWQDNSTSPTLNVTEEGLYWVRVKICGRQSDAISIKFKDCNCFIHTPNAFTPGVFTSNSDNVNKVFSPVSNCDFYKYKLMIFNRWGEKIFETNNQEKPWDGTYKGIMSPNGVYAYQVNYSFTEKSKTKTKYGTVNLIR